jgi:hydrogenase maturation protein HypF
MIELEKNLPETLVERRAIRVEGQVQSVGFRPFVHKLATHYRLAGSVRNHGGAVGIEVEGESHALDEFMEALVRDAPPLAQVKEIAFEARTATGEVGFRIQPSIAARDGRVVIVPDIATCDDCLAELFDPADRRYRYPFINCTNCGPRLTIIQGVPYDRHRTTMASFALCTECFREYEDPTDRRFHAEPIACPACGPTLELREKRTLLAQGDEALKGFCAGLRVGRIGALKGLGGYHLACHSGHEASVAELRRRKHREEKPFALMVQSLKAARELCFLTHEEEDLLTSAARPIVLARRRPSNRIAKSVAPHNPWLGLMLPYTPLHHLVLAELEGVPLVMTSGNRSDEPIAYREEEAFDQLHDIADVFLHHDRPIHTRCDDSVMKTVGGQPGHVRRSRGFAPNPIEMPLCLCAPALAVGAELKATFALGCGANAVLSHHLGDLANATTFSSLASDIRNYECLLGISPQIIAHDRHPDYASTRYALARCRAEGLRLVGVQHHHAHMAACMAEQGLSGSVLGVIFDGTGYGEDGAIWGGEFLRGDYKGFERLAHLRYIGLPGGDRAVREPWRSAAAYLREAGIDPRPFLLDVEPGDLRIVMQMLERRFQCPLTSSAGRLFDAVAAILSIRSRCSFEAQAAMEMEALAEEGSADGLYSFGLDSWEHDHAGPAVVDTRPMIRELAADVRRGIEPAACATRFHATLAQLIVTVCDRLRNATGTNRVVLSGGVFQNSALTHQAVAGLERSGFAVYRHALVPCNDGGICLGQLAVAAANGATNVPGDSW